MFQKMVTIVADDVEDTVVYLTEMPNFNPKIQVLGQVCLFLLRV